jgi:Immunoglobulin domain/Immunoglobulin I-set domain
MQTKPPTLIYFSYRVFFILACALACAFVSSGQAASTPVVLVDDNFDADTPNVNDLNVDIARQTGTLAPITYTMAGGPSNSGHQLQNGNAPDQLLLADFAQSTSSLDQNFNGNTSVGGLKISFDVDPMPSVYASTPDRWAALNLGMSQADQLANVNQAVPHFGILFRAAGTLQAFDGNTVVSPSPEPVYSSTAPGTTNHIEIVITDVDGNPFDGVGDTTIEVYANGAADPVWTYTKTGGYADNYFNLQGNFRSHFDNLTVTQLPEIPSPTIANPSFEADDFTIFPGYVDDNGLITSWSSLGNHGINPGPFGAPFADNGEIPEGTKVAFMQGDGPLSQVLDGFVVGRTYQIQYSENARTGATLPHLSVTMDGEVIVADHAVSIVGGTNPYHQIVSDPFVASATSMELAFVKSNPEGGDTTALIDNVSFLASGTPPSITVQPNSLVAGIGETVTFTVAAVGSSPLSYQWFFGSDPIADATSATLTLDVTSGDQAGEYHAEVINGAGTAVSDPATLTVRASVAGLFNTGVDANGVALADNEIDPHYTLIVNADSASQDAIVENSGAFPIVTGPWLANNASSKWIGPSFETTNAAGLATADGLYVYRTTFDLTGLDVPSVVITGGWAIDNDGVSISVNGEPTGLVNTAGFAGLTPFTLTSANANFQDGINTLDFEVRNADAVAGYTGLRVGNLRGLAVLPGTPPSITSQPQSQVAGSGETVTFTVGVVGSSPLTYQWAKDGVDLSGETGPSLVLNNVTSDNTGSYTVRVSNPIDTVTSDPATLEVFDPVLGLFNTGVDDNGAPLADGAVDLHYQLIVNPDSASSEPLVEDSTVFPIVAGPWLANSAQSKWIGPRLETSQAAGAAGTDGNYVYRLSFDLSGFDPASISLSGNWASDNLGIAILLNGVPSGITNDGNFAVFHPFTISTGFLAGINTMDFVVNNSAVGYTGLRVEGLRGLGQFLPDGTEPVILEQPQSISRVTTETATFFVRANGSAPLSYQWYFGQDPINGETGPTLSFYVDFADLAGEYSVEVSNDFGSVHSDTAFLNVSEAPFITQHPISQVAALGDTITFTAAAIGDPPLAFQWIKDDADLPGEEGTSLTLNSVTEADAGVYKVRVFNFGGEVTSDPATLTIAQTAPGLFNTGVDNNGMVLPTGAVDPHYTLTESADAGAPGPDTFVVDDTLFPIVAGPWLASDAFSKWIGPAADQSVGNLEGNYTYRTTFTLRGFDLATFRVTGEWSVDNTGLDILINGISTGQANTAQFTAWTPFQIDSGFQEGLNTIDFMMNNAPTAVNPTAFRVQKLRGLGAGLAVKTPEIDLAGGTVTLVWQAQSGQTYRVQYKNDFNDAEWTDLAGDVVADGNTASKTDNTIAGVDKRFYRILNVTPAN